MKHQTIKLLFLFIILAHLNANAQEQVGKIDVENTGIFNKNNYSISSKKNNNTVTLLTFKGKMQAHYLHENFRKILSPLNRKLDNGGLNNLVGHKIVGDAYSFIYSDDLRKALAIFTFSFDSKTSEKKRVDLGYKGERIVEAFSSHNDRFFIFFASIKGELILRELTDDCSSLKELARFPISDKAIGGETIKFKRHFLNTKVNYLLMGDDVPSPISKSFPKYKLFNEGNQLILSCENSTIGTSLYIINLNSLELTEKFFDYPKGKLGSYEEFNSYLSNKTLFHIAVSNKEMILQMKSFSNELKNEFYVAKDEEITFKNTVVKQKGGTMIPFKGKRNFESTAKFLRKISSETVGVNVHFNKNQYEITIGGLKDNVALGMLMVATGPNAFRNGAFNTDQITQITCLFDADFNHIDEDIEMNSFDMISEYEKNLKRNTNSNVFYCNGSLYYSYINKKEKELRFLKF